MGCEEQMHGESLTRTESLVVRFLLGLIGGVRNHSGHN